MSTALIGRASLSSLVMAVAGCTSSSPEAWYPHCWRRRSESKGYARTGGAQRNQGKGRAWRALLAAQVSNQGSCTRCWRALKPGHTACEGHAAALLKVRERCSRVFCGSVVANLQLK